MSLKYTEDHEWVSVDGDIGTVGISVYAAKALGDVVFVELPEIGREMAKGDEPPWSKASKRPPKSTRLLLAQ